MGWFSRARAGDPHNAQGTAPARSREPGRDASGLVRAPSGITLTREAHARYEAALAAGAAASGSAADRHFEEAGDILHDGANWASQGRG